MVQEVSWWGGVSSHSELLLLPVLLLLSLPRQQLCRAWHGGAPQQCFQQSWGKCIGPIPPSRGPSLRQVRIRWGKVCITRSPSSVHLLPQPNTRRVVPGNPYILGSEPPEDRGPVWPHGRQITGHTHGPGCSLPTPKDAARVLLLDTSFIDVTWVRPPWQPCLSTAGPVSWGPT